jgi:hypothetical protein
MKPVAFNLPGIASVFYAKEGIAKQWITSFEDTIKRIDVFTGKTYLLSTV